MSSTGTSEREGDLFGRHRWVKLTGLTNKNELNGEYAEIIRKLDTSDQFAVRVDGRNDFLSIKKKNLGTLPDEETAKVCRMASAGEENFTGGFRQTVRWPLSILRSYPNTVISPISVQLGFPLWITKVKPRTTLKATSDYDNYWVTWMMIGLQSGLAPVEWRSHGGPVVVWRDQDSSGNNAAATTLAVSMDDMCLLNVFLESLLDQYSDGDVSPDVDITPAAWGTAKKQILPNMPNYIDINI
jgi:hypothetical protein